MRLLYTSLALAIVGASTAPSQATRVSAPPHNYLLEISQRWGRTSALGDLLRDPRDSTDIEVRLWGGYGLFGTVGAILRRRAGTWSAFLAQVQECPMRVRPDEAMTDARLAELEAQARRNCPNDSTGGTFITAHWLTLQRLPLSSPPAELWPQLVQAGVLQVPPEPHAKWMMLDGFTYVLEVRVGDVYRASVLPQSESSREEADLTVREIARILGFERSSRR